MNQNLIKVFENDKLGDVRVVLIGNREHFIASDIAKVLGYKDQIKAIKQHCRWVAKCPIPHPQNPSKTMEVNVIPEGDLYRLISNSKLPSAVEFESWVYDEVLPTIRSHGAYITPEVAEKLKNNPNYITDLIEQIETSRNAINELKYKNKLLEDSNQYYSTCFDEIMEFIAENLSYAKGKTVTMPKMYNKYCVWCGKKNYAIYGNSLFHELMQERTVQGHVIVISSNKYLNIE